ncbi:MULTISPECIES: hypothetical protein [Nocardia]|uniref:hypothetical protein n=1 Tax=Nocardia TaxID=1817 RepID=UPI001300B4A5|nr:MULTISPECIES: hypothetical protein [Nocardia]
MTEMTRHRTAGFGASAMLTVLRTPFGRRLAPNLIELRYRGVRSGRDIALPVSCVRSDNSVVVRVGRPETKTWWRNFHTRQPVSVWIDGRWVSGTGHVAASGTLEHEEVAAVYQQRYPRMEIPATDPFVVIDLAVDPLRRGAARRRDGLWRRWFAMVTVGELLGFAAPAVAGALVWDATPAAVIVAMLLAGAFEGAALGWSQARVLRSVLPDMRSASWVLATISGAVVAWSVGVVPMISSDGLATWPLPLLLPAVVIGGSILLLSLGVSQWTVLRRHIPRAAEWIVVTAVAWLGGLAAFTAITSPLWRPGQSVPVVVLIGVLGGFAMAATMAAVTGRGLTRLLGDGPRARIDDAATSVGSRRLPTR